MNASLYLQINVSPCIMCLRQPQCWYMFYRSDLPPIVTDYASLTSAILLLCRCSYNLLIVKHILFM